MTPRVVNSDCPFEICDGSGFVVDVERRTTEACRCRPQRIAQAKARKLSSVVPKKYRGVSFDRPPVPQIDARVVRAVRSYVDNLDKHVQTGQSLWLEGDLGTGKTTLAMLVSTHALREGYSVAIYSLPRLLYELRKTFEESSEMSYLQLMDSLAAVDLLHIDDVGAEKSGEWVLEQLYAIVNARYEEEKPIVLTTNLPYEQLLEQIGPRTVSRLVEMCGDMKLPLFGHDRRLEADVPEVAAVPRWGAGPVVYGETPS